MSVAAAGFTRPVPRPGSAGFYLRTGPFVMHVRTRIPELLDEIACLYEGYPLAACSAFADFHVTLVQSTGLRRWYRPKVQFAVDGVTPFKPLPLDQAMPMFEWGFNWCVSNNPSQFLIIHAATIEKSGRAAIMPGVPGSGKSTLTAGLVNRGWRLLSDELTLISLSDGRIIGLARPISLKNESIEVIREFVPTATMSRVACDTVKGRVALLKAPAESIARVDDPARPAWIIFPRYVNGSPSILERKPKAATLIQIAKNSFNYNIYGSRGFTVLADIVDACACHAFTYADLNDAVKVFDLLELRT